MAYPTEASHARAAYSKKERPRASPRLPQLQPNVNRRAQQLIAAHMGSPTTGSSSSTADPFAAAGVLSMLDSTTSRAARTHDISHLCDQPRSLAPCVAPSMLPEEDYVWETSFLPTDATSVFSDQDGLWHTAVFPSTHPSSRPDAVMLDQWITRALRQYGEGAACSAKEELARAIEDLVPILSIALHEMARQVTHHCAERGSALEKIWRTYVELFHRVLRQLQGSLQEQKLRTSALQGELGGKRKDLKRLKEAHPEQMRRVISELEHQFTTRQAQCEEQLKQAEQTNHQLKQDMRAHHKELELWYPGFPLYQDSYIKSHIPQQNRMSTRRSAASVDVRRQSSRTKTMRGRRLGTASSEVLSAVSAVPGEADEAAADVKTPELTPEVAIAQDFKRLLAVLPPEKRRAIGQELNDVLHHDMTSPQAASGRGPRKTLLRGTNQEARRQTELDAAEEVQAERLREEVDKQDLRIAELRREIADLEEGPKAAKDSERMRRSVSFAPAGTGTEDAKTEAEDKDGREESEDDDDGDPDESRQLGSSADLEKVSHQGSGGATELRQAPGAGAGLPEGAAPRARDVGGGTAEAVWTAFTS